MNRIIHTALSRIATFENYTLKTLPRREWAAGDYVVGEVSKPPGHGVRIELANGRLVRVDVGDRLLGALGTRFATLEATGSWENIGDDGFMQAMTAAGLLGRLTSKSPFLADLTELTYSGHVLVEGRKLIMKACVPPPIPGSAFMPPVVLIVGSSMSAGKTRSAQIIIRRLKTMGLRVLAAQLTGAGRYRDVLSMGDAGADAIFDFVDAGLPSTICSQAEYRAAIGGLLSRMASVAAQVAVIEAGASPLEPYNGDTLIELLAGNIKMLLLCASDPYAVVGIMNAFGKRPDLVAGIACNTDAGITLIKRLAGLPALRLIDRASLPALDAMLQERFGLPT
jgi:hypothetical protein